jgi:hypothetical protein
MSTTNKQTRENVRKGASRRGRYITLITLCLIAVIGSAAFVADPLGLLQSQASPDSPSAGTAANDQRMGTIIVQIAPHQCQHVTFDNNDGSGRVSQGLGPCEDDVVFDAQGRPIPMGTMHRLNAISQSFAHGSD